MDVKEFKKRASIMAHLSHELDTHINLTRRVDDLFHEAFGDIRNATTEHMEERLVAVRKRNALLAEVVNSEDLEGMHNTFVELNKLLAQGHVTADINIEGLRTKVEKYAETWTRVSAHFKD